MNAQNIITLGLSVEETQHLISSGFYAPDPRCMTPIVPNGLILQGLGEERDTLITQGLYTVFSDAMPKKIVAFDSPLYKTHEFDSPIITKDLIIRKYKMWI